MDRRSFFRFLPAIPVGITGAAMAKEPDNVVRASPGERCQCGCPTHYTTIAHEQHYASCNAGQNVYQTYVTAETKEICAWCGARWNTKGPYKGA